MSLIRVPRRHIIEPEGKLELAASWSDVVRSCAILTGPSLVDIARPYAAEYPAHVTLRDLGRGPEALWSGASSVGIPLAANGFGDIVPNSADFFAVIRFRVQSLGTRRVLYGDWNSSGTGNTLSAFFEQQAANTYRFGVNTPVVGPVVVAGSVTTGWHTAVMAHRIGVGLYLSIDDAPMTFAASAATARNAGFRARLGSAGDLASIPFNGSMHFAAFGVGVPDDLLELQRNPWQLFRAEPMRIYSLPSAGGDATANGGTLTATASLLAGTASGASAAAANGATLVSAASLVSGAASGAATANGQTLAASASIIAGTASGAATGAGAVLTTTAALIAGSASAGASATANGVTLTTATSLISGTATGASTAAGTTLTTTAALLAGIATGASASTANGQTLTTTASLIAGSATGVRNGAVAGQTVTASATLQAGTASAGSGATASGVTLTAAISLQAGSASAASVAQGHAFGVVVSLLPGSAVGVRNETAYGAVLTVGASIIAGNAQIIIPEVLQDLLRKSVFTRVEQFRAYARVEQQTAFARVDSPQVFTRR